MRVISGLAGGKRLKTPEGMDIRPSTDMVKEALFNIIQFDIEGRRVLDLFAGTGQLGIECLSRGAKEAVFVDKSRNSVNIVKENLKTCGFQAQVHNMDSIDFLSNCGKFDIIFIDPPYNSDLYEKALKIINLVDILSDGGIIVCETERSRTLPDMELPYKKGKVYNYGKVKLNFYKKDGSI